MSGLRHCLGIGERAARRILTALKLGSPFISLVILSEIQAEPRTSANYTIPADTVDAGGGPATSLSYSDRASVGTVAGTAVAGDPEHLLKAGFFARLYDPTGLLLTPGLPGTAFASVVPEGGTLQLSAAQVLDDSTLLSLAAASVAWSVDSGPLTAVSATGLATAGLVWQDTPAVVSGLSGGFAATLPMTVQNVDSDNFGTYASDGLPDGWQVQFFGLDNPLAHPAADASGTGQTNLFKYTAGLDPIDPAARFTLEIDPVNGQPAQKDLTFTPVWVDRTYQVEYTTDLAGGVWLPLSGGVENTVGQVRTVTDPAATEAAKHYRVRITKP